MQKNKILNSSDNKNLLQLSKKLLLDPANNGITTKKTLQQKLKAMIKV